MCFTSVEIGNDSENIVLNNLVICGIFEIHLKAPKKVFGQQVLAKKFPIIFLGLCVLGSSHENLTPYLESMHWFEPILDGEQSSAKCLKSFYFSNALIRCKRKGRSNHYVANVEWENHAAKWENYCWNLISPTALLINNNFSKVIKLIFQWFHQNIWKFSSTHWNISSKLSLAFMFCHLRFSTNHAKFNNWVWHFWKRC